MNALFCIQVCVGGGGAPRGARGAVPGGALGTLMVPHRRSGEADRERSSERSRWDSQTQVSITLVSTFIITQAAQATAYLCTRAARQQRRRALITTTTVQRKERRDLTITIMQI